MGNDTAKGEDFKICSTGVPGLNKILGGGLIHPSLYLLEGEAGTGKTTLSLQIGFELVSRGKKVVYLTLLAESHGKLLRHLQNMTYFKANEVGNTIFFISGYHALITHGLNGLLELVSETITNYEPILLVIDGFRTVRDLAKNDNELAIFVHNLNSLSTFSDCTLFLIAPSFNAHSYPDKTLVDGIISMARSSVGVRTILEIEVCKLRAADHLLGKHRYEITRHGIHIFPRLEAWYKSGKREQASTLKRDAIGIPVLDNMLNGGIPQGSGTTLMGPPGTGKTLLGLTFLEKGLKQGEPALYFGFYETPERLLRKARSVGIHLEDFNKSEMLTFIWQPAIENSLESLGDSLLETVAKKGIKRLCIDGLEGFRESAHHPQRIVRFYAAFTNILKDLNVTTVFTEELPLFSQKVQSTITKLSALVENVFLLQYGESEGALVRVLSIIKVRDSGFDRRAVILNISSNRLSVQLPVNSIQLPIFSQPVGTGVLTDQGKNHEPG